MCGSVVARSVPRPELGPVAIGVRCSPRSVLPPRSPILISSRHEPRQRRPHVVLGNGRPAHRWRRRAPAWLQHVVLEIMSRGGGVRRCYGHRATLRSGAAAISVDPDSNITIVSSWDGGGVGQVFPCKTYSRYCLIVHKSGTFGRRVPLRHLCGVSPKTVG